MKKLGRIAVSTGIALAAAAMAPAAASAATIINGSFELPGLSSGPTYSTVAGGSTTIPGWTVGGASIDYIGGYWQAADGRHSIDLAGMGIGSISQDIETVIGQAYVVTFSVAANLDGGSAIRTGFVDVGGDQTLISFDTTGATKGNMGWETRTFEFVALEALTTLRFSADASTSAQYFGLALDNVAISAVPEPAMWAMMLVGFGAIGSAMRRRTTMTLRFA